MESFHSSHNNVLRWYVHDTVWKIREFSLTHFWRKFRESNGFTKELIWRNIFSWERISRFSTLCITSIREFSVKIQWPAAVNEIWQLCLKNPWNQLIKCKMIVLWVVFTKFFPSEKRKTSESALISRNYLHSCFP